MLNLNKLRISVLIIALACAGQTSFACNSNVSHDLVAKKALTINQSGPQPASHESGNS